VRRVIKNLIHLIHARRTDRVDVHRVVPNAAAPGAPKRIHTRDASLVTRPRADARAHPSDASSAMSRFLWETSGAYRTLVRVTARSKLAMGVFAFTACVALPLAGTYALIETTTTKTTGDAREVRAALLKARGRREGIEETTLRERNKANLLALLEDAERGRGDAMDARYRDAMVGRGGGKRKA